MAQPRVPAFWALPESPIAPARLSRLRAWHPRAPGAPEDKAA